MPEVGEEQKELQHEEEECTCGHYLEEDYEAGATAPSRGAQQHLSPNGAPHLLDTSFVHLPAFLYQQSTDAAAPIRKYGHGSTSSNFWEVHQHLAELIRACQNHDTADIDHGTDNDKEVPLLCSDCISRYV